MGTKRKSRGVVPTKAKEKNVSSTIHVKSKAKFAAVLTQIDKKLKKYSKQPVRVLGMGRAIHTVCQVAAGLQSRKYLVELRTVTMTAVDELVDEEKGTSNMVKRDVPALELNVQGPIMK